MHRFCKQHRSSLPELKAMALPSFPAHPALPTVPRSQPSRARRAQGRSSGSRRLLRALPIPSPLNTGGGVSALSRGAMAEHTLGPGQAPHGPSPPAGPSRAAPRPLTCSAIRCVSSVAGRAAEAPPHNMAAAALRSAPAGAAPRACRGGAGPGLEPAGGARRAGAAGPGSAQPGRRSARPSGTGAAPRLIEDKTSLKRHSLPAEFILRPAQKGCSRCSASGASVPAPRGDRAAALSRCGFPSPRRLSPQRPAPFAAWKGPSPDSLAHHVHHSLSHADFAAPQPAS